MNTYDVVMKSLNVYKNLPASPTRIAEYRKVNTDDVVMKSLSMKKSFLSALTRVA